MDNNNIEVEKIRIERSIKEFDESNFLGNLDNAIKHLKDIKNKYPDKDLEISIKQSGYEDFYLDISYWEEETDEEYLNRMEEEAYGEERYRRSQKEKLVRYKKVEEFNRLKNDLGL